MVKCTKCNKRLNIVGEYKCRCGNVYCVKDRFPTEHECSYDYKEHGRAEISRNNHVVNNPKIIKL